MAVPKKKRSKNIVKKRRSLFMTFKQKKEKKNITMNFFWKRSLSLYNESIKLSVKNKN